MMGEEFKLKSLALSCGEVNMTIPQRRTASPTAAHYINKHLWHLHWFLPKSNLNSLPEIIIRHM